MYSDEELSALNSMQPFSALGQICLEFKRKWNNSKELDEKIQLCGVAFPLVRTILVHYDVEEELRGGFELPLKPETVGDPSKVCTNIYSYINDLSIILAKHSEYSSLENLLESNFEKFNISIGNGFHYEFSDDDLDQIQDTLNKLRELITKTHELDEEHKRRLILKLEKVQTELHKTVSSLDWGWGLLIDAGVAIRQFTNDVEPFTRLLKSFYETLSEAHRKANGVDALPFSNIMGKIEHLDENETENED